VCRPGGRSTPWSCARRAARRSGSRVLCCRRRRATARRPPKPPPAENPRDDTRHSPTFCASSTFARRDRTALSARRAAPRRRSAPAQIARRDGQLPHNPSTHGVCVHQEGSPAGLG
jgi:hypothetical protein